MAIFDVRLLGGFRVASGGIVVHAGPRRVRELFALLLLERHEPVPRERLAYALWPESSERQARTNLRQALHQLRSKIPDVDRLLLLDGPDLRFLNDASLDLDVERFERQLTLAAAARDGGDVGLERRALEAAGAAYAGDLLPDVYASWVEPHRAHLHEALARGLERLVEVMRSQGDDRAAVDVTQRRIEHDPLTEGAYRVLIELHERCGERAKAVHAYHACSSVLRRELGVEPTERTRALYEGLVRGDAPLTPRGALGEGPEPPAGSVPLVGRRDELRSLHDAWRRSASGEAQLVLLTGDAGIGKTRLAEECTRQLRRGEANVAVARCYAAEGALSYAPIATLLRAGAIRSAVAGLDPALRREIARLVPEAQRDAPLPISEAVQRTRLFEALARAFAGAQPLVLVIDDLHWCDQDTLAWLHFMLRFDAGSRLLVLATARSHELSANDALGAWLTPLRDEGRLLEIEVVPLSLSESAALARSLSWREPTPAELGWLYAESEGNPLFLVELVRSGAATRRPGPGPGGATAEGNAALPPRLRAVIRARLERLTPGAYDTAGIASVIGRAFDLDLLVWVCRCDEDTVVRAVDELWRRRVVRELHAGQYDFSHDKLREVAYESLSLSRRRQLHRRVAAGLEALHAYDLDQVSGQIAQHYDRAGRSVQAVEAYLRGARAARGRYAESEAEGHYRRALTLVDDAAVGGGGSEWRERVSADLLEGLGELAARRGQHGAAHERFTRAMAARPTDDRVGHARLWRGIGDTWAARYGYDEATVAYGAAERALALRERTPAAVDEYRERIEIGLARADLHYWQHRWDAMERDLVAVSDMAVEHACPCQLGRLYAGLALMCFSRDRQTVSDACLELARNGYAAGLRTGDADVIAQVGFGLGFLCLWHGDLDEAETLLRTALEDARRVGDALRCARCLTYLGYAARLRGDAVAVRSAVAEGLRMATELGMPEYVGAAHGQRAWLAWRDGDDDACELEGRAALAAWRSGQPYPLQWAARLPLLASCLRRAAPTEAVAHAEALLDDGQQRLPDALEAALARLAVASGEAAGSTVVGERLVGVIEAARSTGRL